MHAGMPNSFLRNWQRTINRRNYYDYYYLGEVFTQTHTHSKLVLKTIYPNMIRFSWQKHLVLYVYMVHGYKSLITRNIKSCCYLLFSIFYLRCLLLCCFSCCCSAFVSFTVKCIKLFGLIIKQYKLQITNDVYTIYK